MKLSQLLYKDEYASDYLAEEVEIEGICSDTHHKMRGCVFVCIRGTKFDTHCLFEYIKDMGAAAVVIEASTQEQLPEGLPCFRVENTRKMLARLWSRFCGSPEKQLKIIGITGTNGKTSTAYMLYSALLAGSVKAGLIGTIGCFFENEPLLPPANENDALRLETMTTPDPDLLYPILDKMAKAGITHVVMEVSSHSLYFDKCEPIDFYMGIFTNLASDHMDLHQSKDGYRKAKEKLFQKCQTGIWNADDPITESMMKSASCRSLLCSMKCNADFYVKNKQMFGTNGLSFMLCGDFGRLTIPMQIPGEFMLYNALLAASAAIALGISPASIRKGLSELTEVKGRIERVDTKEADFSVFIDYAHTEEALRNLLLTIRQLCLKNERIVAVFGCGGDRDKGKRSAMGKCAEELADFSIITSDNHRSEPPEQIIKEIMKGFTKKEKYRVIVDRKKAIEYAIENAQAKDVILLIGKGHETYELCGEEKKPFSERDIVKLAIEKRLAAKDNEG